jgi:ATP-dependent DNA helicase PIF1
VFQTRKDEGDGTVAVTAPTGIAAVNVSGVTIHSFAGIGLGKGDPAMLAGRVRSNTKKAKQWAETRVLVIDEVSMLSRELFELLVRRRRRRRRRRRLSCL